MIEDGAGPGQVMAGIAACVGPECIEEWEAYIRKLHADGFQFTEFEQHQKMLSYCAGFLAGQRRAMDKEARV